MNRFASVVCSAALLAPLAFAQEETSCAEAAAIVIPGVDELAAETIPWRASFRQGALEADQLDRPVLLWAMNGHPLGCT